jgi:50S ribosomal subunit-associated GTPase HflX
LETDRRLLGERVKALRAKLEKLQKQHATQRRARGRNNTFSVSLVGYTNAGKSTLFNAVDQNQSAGRGPTCLRRWIRRRVAFIWAKSATS